LDFTQNHRHQRSPQSPRAVNVINRKQMSY
jgi:hypothetical protein